ncbi:MAG: hypothetical protein KAR19_03690 [Bacteroidales bacterium]|nr:hypothetical protein [Bacteroidales bacterium]
MKKFKVQFNAILKELKLADKAKNNELTPEDWDKIAEAYQAKYNSDFYDDQEQAETEERRGSIHEAALNLLATEDDDDSTSGASSDTIDPNETAEMKKVREEKEAAEKKLKEKEKENTGLTEKIKNLEKDPEPDDPKTEVVTIGLLGPGTTADHLFGIPSDMFSMDQRWNKVAANPAYATLTPVDESDDGPKFRQAVTAYSKELSNRYKTLHESGQLASLIKGAALDVGYADLEDAGLGKQFVIRRQDELIARILAVPTVYDIFPRRYGVQDRELITNAFFGEFSQAYQAGEVWKGDVDLQPELGHVDDAMYKTLFESMKWIERQYIGYLNSEGSDAVKWSMIEWMVLNIAEVLVNEQSKRRIMGIFIKPATGTPGNALFASTGVVHTLIRYIHEHKLLTLNDAAYNTYSNTLTVFVEAVDAFLADALEKRGNLDGYALHLNRNHKMWYKASVRRQYGTDYDFSGPKGDMVVDWDIPIKWVPNMNQSKLMILQKPGNIQCLEFVPGEMFKIAFDRDMEAVKSWSTWKEGVSAAFTGKNFETRALLVANDYDLQEVFINQPATTLADDATTADATANFWFVSQANTTASQNITDITGAKDGEVYIIETGHATNPQTVNKALKFSEIASNFVPTAVGDYLMVHYDPTADSGNGKFYEIERCVAGTRTIVSAKQPNIPGAER